MSERRVWIAQCLCGPNRHAICALAGEADEAAAPALLTRLREAVAALLRTTTNPWCGICGAEEAGWRYELDPTAFRTLEDAGPELGRTALANALSAAVFGMHGPTKPVRH